MGTPEQLTGAKGRQLSQSDRRMLTSQLFPAKFRAAEKQRADNRTFQSLFGGSGKKQDGGNPSLRT